MPEVPAPDTLPNEQELARGWEAKLPKILRAAAIAPRPIEVRPCEAPDDPFIPGPRPPRRCVWMRATSPLPDTPALHAFLLAYASDHSFITTALLPHGVTWLTPGMQVASLDHVMWFHRPFRVDEWFLYSVDSPAAHGARGLVRGSIFAQSGELIASSAQEGLIRQHARAR
jgi:acyl-CoA thioesterase II